MQTIRTVLIAMTRVPDAAAASEYTYHGSLCARLPDRKTLVILSEGSRKVARPYWLGRVVHEGVRRSWRPAGDNERVTPDPAQYSLAVTTNAACHTSPTYFKA